MGGLISKHTTSSRTVHSVNDLPELPIYEGTPIEYRTITLDAGLDVQSHFSFMASNVPIQATNEEQYLPELASIQQQGCKMLAFVAWPGSIKKYGFSPTKGGQFAITKFNGIFRKLFQDELNEKFDLRVVKSTILNEMFRQWSDDLLLSPEADKDDNNSDYHSILEKFHILKTLQSISDEGGKLISIELTGMSEEQIEIQKQFIKRCAKKPHQMTETIPDMQVAVDVFFEIPVEPSREKYIYKIVKCPLESTYKHNFTHGHFTSVFNQENVMTKYFETGWKLTDILEDFSVSHLTKTAGFRPYETQINNCLWLFEKPVSRININEQYYEGIIVDYWVPSDYHGHQKNVAKEPVNSQRTDWGLVINHYGEKGWQIVKILETPDTRFEGPFHQTALTRYYLFFQRKIINQK